MYRRSSCHIMSLYLLFLASSEVEAQNVPVLPTTPNSSQTAYFFYEQWKETKDTTVLAKACELFEKVGSATDSDSAGTEQLEALAWLAHCRVDQNRPTDAWVAINDALTLAKRRNLHANEDLESRRDSIRGSLECVTFDISENANVPDLKISLNDVDFIPHADSDASMLLLQEVYYVEGSEIVTVSAPGYQNAAFKMVGQPVESKRVPPETTRFVPFLDIAPFSHYDIFHCKRYRLGRLEAAALPPEEPADPSDIGVESKPARPSIPWGYVNTHGGVEYAHYRQGGSNADSFAFPAFIMSFLGSVAGRFGLGVGVSFEAPISLSRNARRYAYDFELAGLAGFHGGPFTAAIAAGGGADAATLKDIKAAVDGLLGAELNLSVFNVVYIDASFRQVWRTTAGQERRWRAGIGLCVYSEDSDHGCAQASLHAFVTQYVGDRGVAIGAILGISDVAIVR
jgi:hypothetical protein